MPEEIKETIRKTEKNISKENSPTTSSTRWLAGNAECPYCHGLGYVREDLPIDDPDFGKLIVCSCRLEEVNRYQRIKLYAFSQLDELRSLTFDTFEPHGRIGLGEYQKNSLEIAYNQAEHFAQNLKGWLLLQGKYGCGKTHLAAAIANYAVDQGVQPLFITVPDLLDSLRFAYQDPDATFEERFEEIRGCPLLILDDFGTQNTTNWAQEKLFQIVNYRYINKLPTVVTSNLNLNEIEARIRSRLVDPELVTRVWIDAPDYRRPNEDTGHPELSSLHLHGEQTFGNFDLRKDENLSKDDITSLNKAFKAADKYAKKPAGWIVFIGGYGSGKTHLGAAIANYQAGLGHPPLFVMAPDLLDHLRATFAPNSPVSLDRRFEEIRGASLLVLDDLGTQSMTPWVKEKLYQLFNHRYNAQLPTVITTADSLDEMDPRIRSRMLDARLCEIYAITAPPYTGKDK